MEREGETSMLMATRTVLVRTFSATVRNRVSLRWVAAFLALNTLDAATTVVSIGRGIYENNPLFTTPALVILWKIVGITAVMALLAGWQTYTRLRHLPPPNSTRVVRAAYALPRLTLPIGCALLALVVASNLIHLALGY